MKYFSTFSGIGGFEIGIHNAYNEHAHVSKKPEQEERSQRGERPTDQHEVQLHDRNRATPLCVGYSEIDKYAIKVYEKHFKGVKNYGDITKINAEELPDFDCLVGGFPCQAFSIAGKRGGFNDTRGTLFFDIARILAEKRPRHLVLENVKGLLSHDGGKTFQTILGVLSDLGYRVEWQVLNSKDFGVPQNRERIYFIGHLRGECSGQVFPVTGSSQKIASVAGYISEEAWPGRHQQIRRTYNTDGAMPTIPTGQGGGVMTKIVAQRGRYNDFGKTEQQLEPRKDDISNTLTAVQKDNLVSMPPKIRRLTPLECERLQGFPDNWTLLGGSSADQVMSDTQRYKMCGNAVTTNVVQAVFERIFSSV